MISNNLTLDNSNHVLSARLVETNNCAAVLKHWVYFKKPMYSLYSFNHWISLNFSLPWKWSMRDTCIPSLSHFLTSGNLLRTPDNSNSGWLELFSISLESSPSYRESTVVVPAKMSTDYKKKELTLLPYPSADNKRGGTCSDCLFPRWPGRASQRICMEKSWPG